MNLRFVKVNPTENMTILVEDAVPRQEQPAVAAALMSYGSIGAEQVGFIEPAAQGARARLQMMGGEFCGNAAMSLAAVIADRDGLSDEDITLEVSGCTAPVRCRIETRESGVFGTVSMPMPEKMGIINGCPAVFFPGIVHIISPRSSFSTAADAEAFLKCACSNQSLDAAGLLLFDEQEMSMTPCVYVRATDSAVWERGCASGTAALGAHLALSRGMTQAALRQPGGIITAHSLVDAGQLTALSITGSVRIAARGIATI